MSALLTFFDGITERQLFDPDFIKTAKGALRDKGIFLVRGLTRLSDDEASRFVRQFGDQYAPSEPKKPSAGLDVISFEEEVDGREAGVTKWHLDFSFLPSSAKETMLYCVDPSDQDVRTHFCSLYRIAQDLPAPLRQSLIGKRARFSWHNGLPTNRPFEGSVATSSAVHPVLFVNPANNREVYYYCDLKLERFLEIDEEEEKHLRAVTRSMLTEADKYVHSWQAGDLLMFDAVGMAHRRDLITTDSLRHLKGYFTRFDFPS